jgi:hypothetical protein
VLQLLGRCAVTGLLAETERSPEHRAKPEAPDQRSEGFAESDVRGGRMKYGLLGVLLGACAAAMIACGAAQPRAAQPAAPAPATAMPGQDPHAEVAAEVAAEIDALDRQIADELARAQVPQPAAATCMGAACAEAMSQPFTTPAVTDPQCHPASTDRCNTACTLSTSICTNQQKICDLARQLPGDDWAAGKCESARASCQASHDRCCSCVL